MASSSLPGRYQCRLAPLIPCIQDSKQLYDLVVRLMFLLHANLLGDALSGHRERFQKLFRQLDSFYKQAGHLQYFMNFIKIPSLPPNPPNFLIQGELVNFTSPNDVVVQEANGSNSNSLIDFVDVDLIDTSLPLEPESPHKSKTPPPLPSIDFDRLLKERDEVISQMQHEMEKNEESLQDLTAEKQEYENLVQFFAHKAQVEEERVKAIEEKFGKLKTMYAQMRDDHIKLLRQASIL